VKYRSREAGRDPHADARRPEQQVLKRMKSHEAVSLERLQQKKNDSREDGDVGDHSGNIFRNWQSRV